MTSDPDFKKNASKDDLEELLEIRFVTMMLLYAQEKERLLALPPERAIRGFMAAFLAFCQDRGLAPEPFFEILEKIKGL